MAGTEAGSETDHGGQRTDERARRSMYAGIAISADELKAMAVLADAGRKSFDAVVSGFDKGFGGLAVEQSKVAAWIEQVNVGQKSFDAVVGEFDKGFGGLAVEQSKVAAWIEQVNVGQKSFDAVVGEFDKGFGGLAVEQSKVAAWIEQVNVGQKSFDAVVGEFDKGFGGLAVEQSKVAAWMKQVDSRRDTFAALFSVSTTSLPATTSGVVQRHQTPRHPETLVVVEAEAHNRQGARADQDAEARRLAEVVSELAASVNALQQQLAETAMRNTGSGKSLVRAAGMLFVLVISLEASAMLLASDPALHGQINDLFELPINAISYALLLWPVLVMVSRR